VVAAVMVLEGKTIAHPAGQELCLRLMKTGWQVLWTKGGGRILQGDSINSRYRGDKWLINLMLVGVMWQLQLSLMKTPDGCRI
jgi:hypothetical protein